MERVDWLLVLAFPGSNIVCFLVGRRGMSWHRFGPLVAIGIALRLAWVWLAAKAFEDQLKRALDFIERYQWWLVAGFGILTVASSLRRARPAQR